MAAIIDVAAIKIRPDLTGFRSELRAEVAKISEEVKIPVNLDIDTGAAKATLAAFRALQSRQKINQKVDVDTSAWSKVKNILGDIGGAIGSGTAGLTKFGANFALVGVKMLTFAGAGAGAIGVLQALGPLLVQAAGAGLLLPGALAGAVGTFATVALGMDGIKAAFQRLTPEVNALKTAVSSSFESSLLPAVNNLKAILPGLQVGFQALATTLGGIATHVTSAFSNPASITVLNNLLILTARIIQNVGKAVAPLAVAFVNVANIGLQAILPLTTGFGTAAERVAAFTQSAAGITKIQGWIQGAFGAIRQLVDIVSTLGQIVGGVFTGLSQGAGNLGSSFAPVLNTINDFVHSVEGMSVLNAIGATIAVLGQALSGILGAALQAVTPLIVQLAPIIQQIASIFSASLAPVIGIVGGLLAQLVPIIASLMPLFSAVAGIVAQLAPVIGSLLLSAIGAVTPIVSALVAAITPLLPPLAALISSLVPPLISLFAQLGPLIAQLAPLIGAVLSTAIGVVTAVLPPLVSAVGSLLPPLVQIIGALLPPFNQLLQAAAPILVMVAGFVAQLVSALAPLLPPIASLIAALLPPLITLMTNALRPVLALAQGLLGPLVGAVRSVVDALVTVIGFLGDLAASLTTAVGTVVGWFAGLGARIFGAIGDLAGRFVQFGIDLLAGLARGIASGLQNVLNTVKNVGSSIVSGIKSFFGIGSPSKLMAKDVGRWIPAGIGAGIEKFSHLATDPLDSLVSTLEPAGLAGLTATGPSSVANGVLELQASGVESAVERGLSRAQFNLDSRGVATIGVAGASLNYPR